MIRIVLIPAFKNAYVLVGRVIWLIGIVVYLKLELTCCLLFVTIVKLKLRLLFG